MWLISVSVFQLGKEDRESLSDLKSIFLGFPLINLFLLMLISTQLSHYTLVIFPWLSMLSGISLDYIFRDDRYSSKPFVKFLAFSFLALSTSLITFVFLHRLGISKLGELNNTLTLTSVLLIAIIYLIAAFLLFVSLRNKLFTRYSFGSIFLAQSFLMAILFGNGIIGNPNSDLKRFLRYPLVQDIMATNKIYLLDIHVNSKDKTLLEFYIPKWEKYEENIDGLLLDSFILSRTSSLIKFDRMLGFNYNVIANYKDLSLIKLQGN